MRIKLMLLSVIVIACNTVDQQDVDKSSTSEGREEYLRRKYADPATGEIPDNVRSIEMAHAASMPGAFAISKQEDVQQSETWIFRGPAGVGGRTRGFVVDRTNERVLLAGSVSGGVWRSEDAGLTWAKTTRPDQLHSVSSLVQDPRAGHELEWYHTTGEPLGSASRWLGNGIWKSSDGGRSWAPLPSTVSPNQATTSKFSFSWSMVVHPTSDTTTLVAAVPFTGLHSSADGGATWKNTLPSTSLHSDVITSIDGHLYAGLATRDYYGNPSTRSGIWHSSDVGQTWEDITPSFFPDTVGRIKLASAPSDPRQLIAVAVTYGAGKLLFDNGPKWHSLWKYNSAHGWEDRTASIPVYGKLSTDFNTQKGYDILCAISPVDTNTVVIGGTNLYLSTNGFEDSTKTSFLGGYAHPRDLTEFELYPNFHPDQHVFVFLPSDPNKAYAANDGGVFFTENIFADTTEWVDLNADYNTTQFYAVALLQDSGNPRVLGGTQDQNTQLTTSTDPTVKWARRHWGDGGFCYLLADGKEILVSAQEGYIERKLLDSVDGEKVWFRIDPLGAKDYLWINPYAIDPNDNHIMYQPGGHILWRNTDVSDIPEKIGAPATTNWDSLSSTRYDQARISAVSVSREPKNMVWYGTEDGAVFKMTDALAANPTPLRVDKGMPKGAYVNCIAIDESNADNVVVCFSSYNVKCLFSTQDGGATWTDVTGNLRSQNMSGPATNWISILPYGSSNVYLCGTSTGLYYTVALNGNSTVWIQAGAETIGNVPVFMVSSRASDRYIAVATHGNGIYGGTISELPPRTPTPALRLPLNNSRGVYADTIVVWDSVPGAVSYTVEVSTSGDFTTDVAQTNEIKTNKLALHNLQQGLATYYWRVFAYGVGGKSDAMVYSFRTAVQAPVCIKPTNREENVQGNPITLGWTRITAATTYDLQASTTLGFNNIVASASNLIDTTVSLNGFNSDTRYFWRVRSVDADTSGEWSQRSQFTTGVLTSIAEDESRLFTVAPNPAQKELSVVLSAEMSVPAMITIINEAGETVLQQHVESTELRVNVAVLATGSYVVRVADGRTTQSRVLQIVR